LNEVKPEKINDSFLDRKGNPLFTSEQAAEYLGVHPVTLRRWVSQKRVSCVRIAGYLVRFRIEDLESIFTVQEVDSK